MNNPLQIKIHLNSIGPLKTANAQDENKQGDLIVELLTSSIRDVVYPIDFSIYSTCPRLMGEEPEDMLPLDYSGYGVCLSISPVIPLIQLTVFLNVTVFYTTAIRQLPFVSR